MPAAFAIPAIVGAAGSIGSAAIGAHAAGKAADIQQQGAQGVIDEALKNKQELTPIINDAVKNAQQGALGAADEAKGSIDNSLWQAINWMTGATQDAQDYSITARDRAIQGLQGASDFAVGQQDKALQGIQENLSPYTQAGKDALAKYTDFINSNAFTDKFSFNPSDLANEPGYQFTRHEGEKSLERSAAAKGTALSGSELKAMSKYNQGLAETTYNDAFNRALAAFDTNRTTSLARASGLMGLANLGLSGTHDLDTALSNWAGNTGNIRLGTAQNIGNLDTDTAKWIGSLGTSNASNISNQLMNARQFQANLGVNAAQYAGNTGMTGAQLLQQLGLDTTGMIGNAITGAANARAAGTVGSANAWTGGIQGITGSVNDALSLYQLSKMLKGSTPITYGPNSLPNPGGGLYPNIYGPATPPFVPDSGPLTWEGYS